jgi:hypothetical protein
VEPDATILDLQARAGNTAVTGLLGGDGPAALRVAVQRDKGRGSAGSDKDERKRPVVAMLVIPELGSTVPLQAVQSDMRSRGGGGGTGTREPDNRPADVHIVAALEDTPTELHAAAAGGRMFATVTIAFGRLRLLLAEVIIAGFSVSPAAGGNQSVALTLNAGSIATEVLE